MRFNRRPDDETRRGEDDLVEPAHTAAVRDDVPRRDVVPDDPDTPVLRRRSAGERPPVYEDRLDDGRVDEESVSDQRAGMWYFDSPAARVNSIAFALLLALEGLLALRFLFRAFNASATSGFVSFIYDVSHPFVRPFENAFSNRTWDQGIIELNTLLAMAVWLIAFALLAMVINALLPRFEDGERRIRRRRVTHA